MPTTVSPEQFWNDIPDYVERAHTAATAIFDKVTTDPIPDVQIRASIFNIDAPGYTEHVTDPERIAILWETRYHLKTMEADFPTEHGRLAIVDDVAASRHLRVWAYKTSEDTPLSAGSQGKDEDQANPADQAPNWIGSDTRAYLGNLITPGYIFLEGQEPCIRPSMFAYTYTNADVQMGKHHYHGSSGVGNIRNYSYINALAPPYTPADAQLLEGHNVQTYHAHKLGHLLGAMEGIVQEAG